jgi:uncharacterized protein YqgC (DUF456 family)
VVGVNVGRGDIGDVPVGVLVAGPRVGARVGSFVGRFVGAFDGLFVGAFVGRFVGALVGCFVGGGATYRYISNCAIIRST